MLKIATLLFLEHMDIKIMMEKVLINLNLGVIIMMFIKLDMVNQVD